MKYIYVIVFFASLAFPVFSLAQYESIRQPLTPEEMALYKKNKVMAELQKIMENGVAKNYKASAIDTGGRLLASITYLRNQYYLYDDAGRIIAYLDSSRGGDGSFTERSYSFTYDDKSGKLKQALVPEGTINFSFDATRSILTQSYIANDSLKLSKYFFDASKRIIAIEGYDNQNKLVSRVERAFSSNGTLHREEIVANFPAGTDSTIVIYLYDAKKQLQRKQVFNFRKFYVSMDDSGTPTHSAEQSSAGTFNYIYDKKGNKISEEYTNSIDKLSNYYLTWQYNEKGLITKRTVQRAKAEPEIIVYEYGFFE